MKYPHAIPTLCGWHPSITWQLNTRGHIQIISNFIMISIRVDVNGVEGRVEPRKLGGQLS